MLWHRLQCRLQCRLWCRLWRRLWYSLQFTVTYSVGYATVFGVGFMGFIMMTWLCYGVNYGTMVYVMASFTM